MRQCPTPSITLVALLPLIVFGLVMIGILGIDERSRGRELLRHTAESAAAVVEREVAAEIGALEALATSPHLDHSLDTRDLAVFRDQAQRVLAVRSDWSGVTLELPERQVVNTAFPLEADLPPPEDPDAVAQTFRTARSTITGIAPDRTDRSASFFVIRVPVVRDGIVRYSLSSRVDARALLKALQHQPMAEGGRILVLNHHRQIFAAFDPTRPADMPVTTDSHPAFHEAIQNSADGFFYGAETGEVNRFNARVTLTRCNWAVVASAPVDIVEWPLRRTLAVAAGSGIGALLLSGWLGTVLAHGIARRHEAERRVVELEAEGQLRDSESMLGLAQEAAHAGSFDWDVTTGQCRWSEKYARLFGVEGETADYNNWLRRIHADDRATIESAIGEAFDGIGDRVSLSYRMVHPQRGIRWIESHHRIIRGENGRPVRMVGINLDITARRMAEIRLKLAHEAADIATWEWNLRTGEERTSEEHIRQCGLPPEAGPLSYEAWLERVHPEDRVAMQATVARFADGVFDETEFRLIQPDGSVRWFVTKGRVFCGGDGAPSHVLGINIDITGRKQAETALLDAKAEAERANAAKSRFLAAASHDLRQPVQSMYLFSSILSAKVREPANAKVVRHLSKSLDA